MTNIITYVQEAASVPSEMWGIVRDNPVSAGFFGYGVGASILRAAYSERNQRLSRIFNLVLVTGIAADSIRQYWLHGNPAQLSAAITFPLVAMRSGANFFCKFSEAQRDKIGKYALWSFFLLSG
jgi:hypothetical protein